ncbi:N-6 DNA methylase [Candidatus Poriferisocius sp.]|uniref:N-6 DNA methylase n=1 Tax=Candidatus Poriferisocius sp. TaxID=3101276 RepID=UPI003B020E95
MPNERNTEEIVRSHFRQYADQVEVEEQKSKHRRIEKLLASASKGGAGRGYPEFLVTLKDEPDLLIVIECKADRNKHESPDRDRPIEFAVDGAMHYSSYLSKEFDVICIGISGETHTDARISHFLHLKGVACPTPIFDETLLSPSDYIRGYYNNPDKYRQDYDSLKSFLRILNERLHRNKVAESNRALLISAILIALENPSFKRSYGAENDSVELAKDIQKRVLAELKADLDEEKLRLLEQKFSFIEHETALIQKDGELRELVQQIDSEINSFIKNHEYRDVLGELYVEFLRYANKDKGLGIVLTPPHITELFADLAQVNKSSIVYDNCAGTGGFLISAMKRMITDAKGSEELETRIKNSQLFGVELQADIFPLAVSNMFIHQDGKSNIEQASCFDTDIIARMKIKRPTVGMLNPPYKSNKRHDKEEWEFVLNNLDILGDGGICIAIIPMQSALSTSDKIINFKSKLMKKHTLEAVLSMPNQLFFNSKASAVTCVMVIIAHRPHPKGKKVWLALAKDDGYVVEMHKGRVDPDNKWPSIRDQWVRHFLNRDEVPYFSEMRELNPADEWCAEACITRDYRQLTQEDFQYSLRLLTGAMFSQGKLNAVHSQPISESDLRLTDREWEYFNIGETFAVTLGPYTDKRELIEGSLPYITRTASNNGVDGFGRHDTSYEGNCITIGAEGVVAFYQPDEFLKGNKVNIIRHERMSAGIGIFLVTVMDFAHKGTYNYGYALVKARLERSRIPLPVIKPGLPDWDFMESYIGKLNYSSNLKKL